MRQLFPLVLILLTPLYIFGQSFTVDTRVDSLDENYYKLSYSFSDTVLSYEEQDYGLPFPFFMTTPADKFTVDSLWVNDGRTEFEIYLNTEDSVYYTFLSNNVIAVDSTILKQPSIIAFNTYPQVQNYHLSGIFEIAVPISKSIDSSYPDTVFFSITTATFLLDYSAAESSFYQTLKNLTENGEFYEKNDPLIGNSRLITFINKFGKQSTIIKSTLFEGDFSYEFSNYSQPILYNFEHYERSQQIDFSIEATKHDSVIFLFADIIFNNDYSYNHVNVVSVHEDRSLVNIESDITNLDFRSVLFTSNHEELYLSSPNSVELSNHPNPFNPSTQLQYTLPEAGSVTISVFNVLGQQVRTLAEGTRSSGAHTTTFNATGLPAGMYVVRLESTNQSGKVFAETKKVMLLK